MNIPRSKSAKFVSRNRALAAALTSARQRAGLSQRQLARQLARPHSFVAKIEVGSRSLKVWELVDYARVLCLDLGEFLRQMATVENVLPDD